MNDDAKIVGICINERLKTDTILLNWWLCTFLLFPFTLGIFSIILFFQRTNRVDRFIGRKFSYYQSLLEFTERYAESNGILDLVRHDLKELKQYTDDAFSHQLAFIGSWSSFFLILFTLGIWFFMWLYKINRIWYVLEEVESDFHDSISKIWMKIDLTDQPLRFPINKSKNRNYGLYLLFTIITAGIWGLVWDYRIHTDPENLYHRFHEIENKAWKIVSKNLVNE